MTTFRNSLGQEQHTLPVELYVTGLRPRTRRSLWHIAVQAWAALTFIAVAVVAFTIIGGR